MANYFAEKNKGSMAPAEEGENYFAQKNRGKGPSTRPLRGATPEEPMTPEAAEFKGRQQLGRSILHGAERSAAGAANFLQNAGLLGHKGPGGEIPGTKDEDLRVLDEKMKGDSLGGTLVGSGIVEAPLGALKLGAKGGSLLARGLDHVIQGGGSAAINASPDDRGTQAAQGTGLSMAMSTLGKGAGRLIKGLVEKSDDALHLEHLARDQGKDLFIPVSQSAKEGGLSGAVGNFYKHGVSNIPFVGWRIEKQGDKARDTVREIALERSKPANFVGKLDADNTGETVHGLNQAFKQAYEKTVKSYAFNLPSDFYTGLESKLKAKYPNIDDTTLEHLVRSTQENMDRFASGKGHITGDNLLSAKNKVGEDLGKPEVTGAVRDKIGDIKRYIDDHIEMELKQGSAAGNIKDLKEFQDLAEPWSNFRAVQDATEAARARKGNFNPRELAQATSDIGPQRDLGATGNAVVGDKASMPSFVGRTALSTAVGGVGAYMNPMVAAGMTAGGMLASNKSTQRALTGDTALQRKIAEILRNNPEELDMLGGVSRRAAATYGAE